MQIFVSKNNRQLGPFDEGKVLEMLQTGQLSPNDLSIRQGQSEWQPLRVLFPNASPAFKPPEIKFSGQAEPPPKSGGSRGVLFGLLGCGGLLLVGAIGVAAFLIFYSPKREPSITNRTDSNMSSNSNVSAPSNTSPFPNSNGSIANKKELDDKLKDLAKLNPPAKLENAPVLKGKILIVEQLDRENDSSLQFSPDYQLSAYGVASSNIALNIAEIDTLIHIKCGKGRELGKYGPRTAYYVAYSNICTVSVIDYKASKTIGQKTFVNGVRPKTIPANGSDFINPPPMAEVEKYLSGLAKE